MDCPTLSKVLLVEDDQKLARLIASFLSQHGFEVRQVHRGDATFAAFLDFKPQVVVLDLMLPGQNGLQVCREIRRVANLPILILTAQEDDLDHILGLESGADDYVIKPIEPPVLLARLRALMRRHAPLPASPESLTFGKLNIDRRRREAELEGLGIELTTMEFELLWLLASQAGEILSRDEILNQIRGIGFDGLNRSVDVCISKLRNKLKDNPREPVRIKTVWGKGYLFNPLGWEL
ncbi:TPA: response regulator transcription factor ParR [Pseudomonas aeruginosa]